MRDKIFADFLASQLETGMELADASDILTLTALEPAPCTKFRADYKARTQVRLPDGKVKTVDGFSICIGLPVDYLRRKPEPTELAHWLGPVNPFLPNVRAFVVCLGNVLVGTPLPDLLYQAYEVGVLQRFQSNENDALDWDACSWVREHADQMPLDNRPLKRARQIEEQITGGTERCRKPLH